jgi:hypothetical protein
MQVEPRIQTPPAPVLNQVLRRSESPEVLIALPHRFVLTASIAALSHQDGNLRAQLRQLERTCCKSVVTLRRIFSFAYMQLS